MKRFTPVYDTQGNPIGCRDNLTGVIVPDGLCTQIGNPDLGNYQLQGSPLVTRNFGGNGFAKTMNTGNLATNKFTSARRLPPNTRIITNAAFQKAASSSCGCTGCGCNK